MVDFVRIMEFGMVPKSPLQRDEGVLALLGYHTPLLPLSRPSVPSRERGQLKQNEGEQVPSKAMACATARGDNFPFQLEGCDKYVEPHPFISSYSISHPSDPSLNTHSFAREGTVDANLSVLCFSSIHSRIESNTPSRLSFTSSSSNLKK